MVSNNLLIIIKRPGLWFGFLFLSLLACHNPAADRITVGTDYCVIDSTFIQRNATADEFEVYLQLIQVDTQGHYMNTMLDNGTVQWYITAHDGGTARSTADKVLAHADSIADKYSILEEGMYYHWNQGAIWRITLLLPQSKVNHVLQLDAFFAHATDTDQFTIDYPIANFIATCD